MHDKQDATEVQIGELDKSLNKSPLNMSNDDEVFDKNVVIHQQKTYYFHHYYYIINIMK